MKVAIVHDWLTVYGGAERVLAEILGMFPDADLFAVVDFLDEEHRARLHGRTAHTTIVQRLPFARKRYRAYLPLMMAAVEQLDMSGYDLVISSSYAVAKGVITGPDQIHISYVHSPIRYAWDLQHVYLREAGLVKGLRSLYARTLLHYVRLWDLRTANGVDHFIANSRFIRARIWKAYRREAEVIHPPVDVDRFTLNDGRREDYYVTASRLVPYKRVPMIAEAFRAMPDKKLLVIGEGPEMPALRQAAGPNVEILGYQSDAEMKRLLRSAKAFVFAAEEDFGIAPVEAQACGTPVIAYGRGGVVESVVGLDREHPTGVFFAEQTAAAVVDAVHEFERNIDRFDPHRIRENAMRFAPGRFRDRLRAAVETQMAARRQRVDALRHDDLPLIGDGEGAGPVDRPALVGSGRS